VKRVIVHIESLALKGFRYEDRHTIAAALQAELARMLAASESAQQVASLGSVSSLKLGSVNLGTDTKPQQVGAATGRAIGRGLLK
jgi:hypothetical protein